MFKSGIFHTFGVPNLKVNASEHNTHQTKLLHMGLNMFHRHIDTGSLGMTNFYTGGYVVTVGKVMGIYTVLFLFNKLWGQQNIYSKI